MHQMEPNIIPAGLFLSQKYKEVKQGTMEHNQAFDELNNTVDPDMIIWWEEQERKAQASRINNLCALDTYDVWLNKGARPQLGAATWLVSRITIEEVQIALAMEIQRIDVQGDSVTVPSASGDDRENTE
ncbi:hypothetical protein BDR04DRAFT_1117516 [Suillus decipiens]|nr:hypothetical protein BDR04DRAFT_1117516 [Suillus decipiens]